MDGVQLAVERPVPGIVLIRVAGNLDGVSAVRVNRLVEQQLRIARSRPDIPRTTIVVDLADVRHFGTGGLETLSEAARRAVSARSGMLVTGLDARREILPQSVAEVIPRLTTSPTVESALRHLMAVDPFPAPDADRSPPSASRSTRRRGPLDVTDRQCLSVSPQRPGAVPTNLMHRMNEPS